jgi:hypothetical protein
MSDNKTELITIVRMAGAQLTSDGHPDIADALHAVVAALRDDDLTAHDAELTERLKAEAIETINRIERDGPWRDAHVYGDEGTPYVNGARHGIRHSTRLALAAIRTLSTTPTPERSNT